MITEVPIEVFRSGATACSEKNFPIIFFRLDISDKSKTATARLLLNEKEIDLTSRKEGKSVEMAIV
jgi:hypothetical protein